jgi:hypothetical protein
MNGITNADERLNFFISAIVAPGIKNLPGLVQRDIQSWTTDLGAIEIVHWASLGTRIGYLNEESIRHVLSQSGVDSARSRLRRCGKLTEFEKDWLDVIRNHSGDIVFREPSFRYMEQMDPESRKHLQGMFQATLLLSHDFLHELSTSQFLDEVGWGSGEKWLAYCSRSLHDKDGSTPLMPSVVAMQSGFANVLGYWKNLGESWRALSHPFRDLPGQILFPTEPWRDPHGSFQQTIRAIVRPRFHLDDPRVGRRYLQFAGSLVESSREDSAEWRDMVFKLYEELIRGLFFAGGQMAIGSDSDSFEAFLGGMADRRNIENATTFKLRRRVAGDVS